MIIKANTILIPRNVTNSNILLTGACPLAIHLVIKYTNCTINPAIVNIIPIFPETPFLVDVLLSLMLAPKNTVAIKYRIKARYSAVLLTLIKLSMNNIDLLGFFGSFCLFFYFYLID